MSNATIGMRTLVLFSYKSKEFDLVGEESTATFSFVSTS